MVILEEKKVKWKVVVGIELLPFRSIMGQNDDLLADCATGETT